MYQIISKAKYFTGISVVLLVATIVLWFAWGLQLGIDFTGGTAMQIEFPELPAETEEVVEVDLEEESVEESESEAAEATAVASIPTIDDINATLAELELTDAVVQTAGESGYVLRMQQVTNDQRQQILDAYAEQGVLETSFSSIGPSLGQELKEKAILALALVLLAIIGYVSYAFRKVSKGPVPSWVFGFGAIAALVHDVLITVGVFIVLGKYAGVQIDAYFITALLTVLGFSVNDTIVVYDRVREGLKDRRKKSFAQIVNESINNTIARSLNTSITTLLVLVALYLFGGASIQNFVLALIVGITAGTYSSIFIASPLLLLGQRLLKK